MTNATTPFADIQRIVLADGRTKFRPIGQTEFDTAETLQRDGIISQQQLPNGDVDTTVRDPSNLRWLCWAAGVNLACRKAGQPEAFPELPIEFVRNDLAGRA